MPSLLRLLRSLADASGTALQRLIAMLFAFHYCYSFLFGEGVQDMKVLLPPVGFADSPGGACREKVFAGAIAASTSSKSR